MKIINNLKQWFKCLTGTVKPDTPKDNVRVITEMFYNIISPENVMSMLAQAIALDTLKPASVSLCNIKLYSLFNRKDKTFVGSCYALKSKGYFYGNIVGSKQIIKFTSDAFSMHETSCLYIPLNCEEDKMLVFESSYDKKASTITIYFIKWITKKLKTEKTLHEFADGASFKQAYEVYKKLETV